MKKALVALLFTLFVSTVFPEAPAWLPDIWNVTAVYQIAKEGFALNSKKPEKPYAFEFLKDGKAWMRVENKRIGSAFAWEFRDDKLIIIQGSRESSEQLDLIDDDLLMMYEQNPSSSKAMILIMAREKRK
jgi:hypothetical protein